MKNIFIILISFMLVPVWANPTVQNTNAQIQNTQPQSITTPQNIAYENCTRMFEVNKEKLFYLTLGAISANNFLVEEIQTENGYIIFYAAKNKYLATIAAIDGNNSILKISPCNEIYLFPPGILLNMYKYIELNLNTEIS